MLFGVDNCKGGGQVFTVGVVMVTDNEIQADGPCVKRFLRGSDSAIHRDDQFHTIRFEEIQCFLIEIVSLIESIRDVTAHVCTECLKSIHEQRGGGDPV